MGKINLLGAAIADLIAAGEVVDRPSSALKELAENAVDAGATHITAEIRGGGVEYMRLADDGEGMDADDLRASVLRHATSKIASREDLESIGTLGFRGEALAAIAAVSDIRIFTRRRGAEFGLLLEAADGGEAVITEAGCAPGTSVVLSDLFARVPARRKFLKKDVSEAAACLAVIRMAALANPGISFRFISEGEEKLYTPGSGKLLDAAHAVMGAQTAGSLIEVQRYELYGMALSGYTCGHNKCRPKRTDENFFVNGRYIRSRTMAAAIEQAYRSVAETSKFPLCVLFLEMDGRMVDVNVHPQKLEVRFASEREVFELTYHAVKNALASRVSGSAMELAAPAPIHTAPPPMTEEAQIPITAPVNDDESGGSLYFGTDFKNIKISSGVPEAVYQTETEINVQYVSETDFGNEPPPAEKKSGYKYTGEVFNAYIVLETADALVFIDKHAAHERVLYDRIKKGVTGGRNASQLHMAPVTAELFAEAAAAAAEYKGKLESLGFDYDVLHSGLVMLRGSPPAIGARDAGEVFAGLAEALASGGGGVAEEELNLLAAKKSAACRAAMKAGIADDEGHLRWLADLVMSGEASYCPHGRPVSFRIEKKRIDSQFNR